MIWNGNFYDWVYIDCFVTEMLKYHDDLMDFQILWCKYWFDGVRHVIAKKHYLVLQ